MSIKSYCLPGTSPSRDAVARVVDRLDDDTAYKAPVYSFDRRPAEELAQYGGVVVHVRSDRLRISKTLAKVRSHGFDATAVAITNLGLRHSDGSRLLFIGYESHSFPKDKPWLLHSSSDRENVCR